MMKCSPEYLKQVKLIALNTLEPALQTKVATISFVIQNIGQIKIVIFPDRK